MTKEQKQEAKSKMEDAKEERRQQILSCACCTDTAIEDMLRRDDVVSGLEDSNEDDVSVLLASLLMDESEIEVKESYLSSSACRGSLSSMLAFAVVGVISIVV